MALLSSKKSMSLKILLLILIPFYKLNKFMVEIPVILTLII